MARDYPVNVVQSGSWGILWLLAYIGAAVYFVSSADGSFWGVIFALLRAIAWPAYLVFHLLEVSGA
jgi:hypothetical protein